MYVQYVWWLEKKGMSTVQYIMWYETLFWIDKIVPKKERYIVRTELTYASHVALVEEVNQNGRGDQKPDWKREVLRAGEGTGG